MRKNNFGKERPIPFIGVVPRDENESIEKLIRRFRKKVVKSGVLKEFVAKQTYEKPSDKKRREKKQNINRCKRREEKEAMQAKELETLENSGKRSNHEKEKRK